VPRSSNLIGALAAALGLVPEAEAEALLAAADKVAAMLTGLIRKHSGSQ